MLLPRSNLVRILSLSRPVLVQQVCSFYPEHLVKRDRFRQILRKLKEDKTKCLNRARESVLYSLELKKSPDPMFIEDLRTLAYLAPTDEDLLTVLKALQTYPDMTPEAIVTIYVRKLVFMNKLKEATDTLLNKNNSFDFMQNISCYIALIDALIDSGEYLKVLEIFETKFLKSQVIPRLVFIAVSLSLLRINDKSAFEKLKSYVGHMQACKQNLPIGSVVHGFFLALNQNDFEYAFKFLTQTDRVHKSLYCNLLTIGLSKIDQVGAALAYSEDLKSIDLTLIKNKKARSSDSLDGRFFRMTLDSLKEAVTRSRDSVINERFNQITGDLSRERIIEEDLIEYYCNSGVAIDQKDFKITKNN